MPCLGCQRRSVCRALATAIRKTVLTCRFNSIGRVTVGEAQLAITAVARDVRCGVNRDANMTYKQSQEDCEANMSGGKTHVRYDHAWLLLFRASSVYPDPRWNAFPAVVQILVQLPVPGFELADEAPEAL